MMVCLEILYVGGVLEHEVITASLGIQPTSHRTKGEKKIMPNGTEVIYRNGVWAWSIEAVGNAEVIDGLISTMADTFGDVMDLLAKQTSEHAWIDFYIDADEEDKVDGCDTFLLSAESAQIIGRAGLPVKFTITTTVE